MSTRDALEAPPLRCEGCGLVYSRAAIAREVTLATGVTCRRCGGRLRPSASEPTGRDPVVAVRSPLGGRERLRAT